ncbi:phage tail tape measure protein [Pseudomonas carnis]|uniref:Phage tail tape measure protein n=1 Tax=Pseudomonas carnis TaxID=2487355 RepID=A0ABT5RP10_9PSED|nr:phage tail tape measure protein [Pseudomonas carnis]MDD1947731.1 phage tail tape measure protein [Pseudomonas carnis]
MSGTIAQLGIEVNSGDAVQAATDLDRLTQAGAKAEKAADGVAASFDKAATASTGLATAEGKLVESTDDAMKRLTAMAKASLESSEYYQRLTTSVGSSASAMDASGSSVSSLAALKRRLQAESDALVGSTDKEADAAKKAAGATGVQAEGLQALLGKINPAIAALDKLDQQQAQLQKYKAAGLIDADTFREYSTRIDASRQKLGDFDEGLRKTGVSSKQTEAALRQLPAQFTDIFTSLAGGQNPLLVLLQQGGQIKDSFGGVGATFDALGAKIKSLVTGGAGAAVLGESLAGIAVNAKDMAENTGKAGESLSGLAEGANTAADATKNAKEAAAALNAATPPLGVGLGVVLAGAVAAAAAIAALGFAYKQGSAESTAYTTALAMTGNTAGTTASQLSVMAKSVSESNGTINEAAASLALLAGSTRIPVTSFEMIATAAANFEDATDKAASETVANFEKIAKDPVKAVLALNESMNFLTVSTYEQITSLERQGRTQEAATVASKAYADSLNTVSANVKANLGVIESAWKDVADGAKGAWDAMLNVGREKSFADKMSDLERRIADFKTQGESIGGSYGASLAANGVAKLEAEKTQLLIEKGEEDRRAAAKGFTQQQEQKAVAAAEHIGKVREGFQSNERKRDKEILDYRKSVEELRKRNADSPLLDEKLVAKDIQNIKDKYKDPKAASAGAVDLTGYNTAQNALKEIQAEYANTQKQLDAAQKAGLISQQEYLLKREALIGNERDEVTAAYETEIAALEAAKSKASTTAEQRIQLDQKIADARADMVKAQKSADSELEVLATNELGRLKKQEQAVQTYTSALQQQVETLREQGKRAAAGLGQGDRQRGLTDQQNAIDDRFNSQKLDLANQYGDGSRGMSLDEYTQKLAALKNTQQDLHDTVQANYDEMTAAQGDWSLGASSAWQSYLESARDVAGQTKSLFTNAFSSMEDAIVNFAMTGKLSFADFTKSILADMARIATRQASSALLSSLVGAATSYFTGGGGGNGLAAGSAGATSSNLGASQAGYSSAYLQADGGAWANGVQMFANGGAFTNSIVSKPTAFGMAGGGLGVMGEAGEEAIMPLTRTAGGQLGVRAISGGGSGGGNVYNFPVAVSMQTQGGGGAASTEDTTQLGKGIQQAAKTEAETAIARALQPGGSIWRLTNGRG